MGIVELIFVGVLLGSVGAWIWGLVDILGRNAYEWKAIGQDRTLWLVLLLFVGVPGALGYLLAIRPKLERVKALGPAAAYPMLAPPPPGWYPDPSGGQYMRWFDGRQWMAQTAPMGSVPMGGVPMGPPPGHPQGYPPSYPHG